MSLQPVAISTDHRGQVVGSSWGQLSCRNYTFSARADLERVQYPIQGIPISPLDVSPSNRDPMRGMHFQVG
jgi:hypothetical protein